MMMLNAIWRSRTNKMILTMFLETQIGLSTINLNTRWLPASVILWLVLIESFPYRVPIKYSLWSRPKASIALSSCISWHPPCKKGTTMVQMSSAPWESANSIPNTIGDSFRRKGIVIPSICSLTGRYYDNLSVMRHRIYYHFLLSSPCRELV